MDILQSSPIDIFQIYNATSKDPVLSKVRTLILQGWIYTPDKELQPYLTFSVDYLYQTLLAQYPYQGRQSF